MSHYTEQSRTTSRNGSDYQPVEPNQATLDLICGIRLENAKIAHRKSEAQRIEAAVERLTARVAALRNPIPYKPMLPYRGY